MCVKLVLNSNFFIFVVRVIVEAHLAKYLLLIQFFVNVSESVPSFGRRELEKGHISLQRLRRPIIVPQFQTAFHIVKRGVPVTRDVTLKRLSKYGVKLSYVLLQTHYVTIKSKHVVYAFILETFDVD